MSAGAYPREPAPAAVVPSVWQLRGRTLLLDQPIVVGVLNVTPDSFSDGGRFSTVDAAVERAEVMLHEGVDVIDVGGESTRPQNASPVDVAVERQRVVPVVRELVRRFPDAVISVDTLKSEVARAAVGEGAAIVNDVSGFRLDPDMARTCAELRVGVVLMHSRGEVHDMATYVHAEYGGDVAAEVAGELSAAVARADEAGVDRARVVLDPGIGFAKRGEHSLAVLGALPRLAALGRPILVGVSRKRFIGDITGEREADQRVFGTVGANVAALMLGARLFRVHDVRAARQSLDVAWAVLGREPRPRA